MSNSDAVQWQQANNRFLQAELARMRRLLRSTPADGGVEGGAATAAALNWSSPVSPALLHICELFGLSQFERDVLLLSAGVELDPDIAADCVSLAGAGRAGPVTCSFALARLPNADWTALTPVAPLRYWRLVELTGDGTLSGGALRIDERILNFLQGMSYLDVRLRANIELVAPPEHLPPSQQKLAREMQACLKRSGAIATAPVLQLCGRDSMGKRHTAAVGCALLNFQLHVLKGSDLPALGAERAAMSRLWQREALLSNSALLIESDADTNLAAVTAFVDRTPGLMLVASREGLSFERPTIRVEVGKPSALEQRALWHAELGERVGLLNGHLAHLTTQFDLEPAEIHAASVQAIASCQQDDAESFTSGLWSACRSQARRHIRDLARHVEPRATWRDLVLPDAQLQSLRDMVSQIRHRAQVYEEWGFASKGARGLGVGALFSGTSGTGKTLAAEVIANDLRLDLHHIDLSQVVSKYIGETEKNLRLVFDAAQDSGAVLLFDEADALFGKRSDVKDSHDRYANVEISYLLQRMEEYRGLAILTTNMRSQIDTAFTRRLRFIVHFPFPDAVQRQEIWRRVFPDELPTDGLHVERLAQLNVSGGSIRNIALHASFYAADAGEPVRMSHLLRAAHLECGKLEKAVASQEVRGWT